MSRQRRFPADLRDGSDCRESADARAGRRRDLAGVVLFMRRPRATNGAWPEEARAGRRPRPSPTFAFREALRAWFSVFPEGIGLFWRSAIAS